MVSEYFPGRATVAVDFRLATLSRRDISDTRLQEHVAILVNGSPEIVKPPYPAVGLGGELRRG